MPTSEKPAILPQKSVKDALAFLKHIAKQKENNPQQAQTENTENIVQKSKFAFSTDLDKMMA